MSIAWHVNPHPNPHPQFSPPTLTANPHPNLHPNPIQDSERELRAMRRRSEDMRENLKNTVVASGARAIELEGASHQLTEELLALRSQQRDTEARLPPHHPLPNTHTCTPSPTPPLTQPSPKPPNRPARHPPRLRSHPHASRASLHTCTCCARYMRCIRSACACTYQGSLHEASVELRRIKGGAAATWLVATKCLQAEVEQLEQEVKATAGAAAELRHARGDAEVAAEAAEVAEARAEAAEVELGEARARKGDSGAAAHVAGANPALQAENESLRQKATALQQEKAELQTELQWAVQRSKQGDAEQITRIAKDAAVLVGGMYELEMELTELLERVNR